MTYTKADLNALGAKLDALDLTDGEGAALHAIFDAATPDDEVEGFTMPARTMGVSTFSGLIGGLINRIEAGAGTAISEHGKLDISEHGGPTL